MARLPPLNSLRLFEAAARLLSFKHASEELSLTPSAVSHGVQALEEWLGKSLFVRSRQGLRLTEVGAAYYPIVQDALQLLISGSEKIAGKGTSNLTISCAPTFASRWLLPRLPDFRQLHPELDVVIDTAHEQIDLRRRAVDLAIRMGSGEWDGLCKDRLFIEELLPVCSPTLLQRADGNLDFTSAPLIHLTSVHQDWSAWASLVGHAAPDPVRGLRFDMMQMAFYAAVQGLGIVVGRKPLIDQELQNGSLVEVGWPPARSSTAYWVVSLEERSEEAHIRGFRQWILDQRDRVEEAQGTGPSQSHQRS